jgi:hypothetical protein
VGSAQRSPSKVKLASSGAGRCRSGVRIHASRLHALPAWPSSCRWSRRSARVLLATSVAKAERAHPIRDIHVLTLQITGTRQASRCRYRWTTDKRPMSRAGVAGVD